MPAYFYMSQSVIRHKASSNRKFSQEQNVRKFLEKYARTRHLMDSQAISDNIRFKDIIGKDYFVDIVPSDTDRKSLLEEKIAEIKKQGGKTGESSHGEDRSFLLADLGDIIKSHKRWERNLPRVKPYYAVKCNNEYPVLKVLSDLGINFDCASQAEISSILELGVHPSRIIFANTIKPVSSIHYAAQNGVELMTFDNEEELYKIWDVYPTAKHSRAGVWKLAWNRNEVKSRTNKRLLLRIKPEGTLKVKCDLSKKFGCFAYESRDLFLAAKTFKLDVVGVSFHVGSGCEDPSVYRETIRVAREVFNTGIELGFSMTLLDIGGGFPGIDTAEVNFEETSSVINNALDAHFPEREINIVAEPGRYFVASAYTLAAPIIGTVKRYPRNKDGNMREQTDKPPVKDRMYYLNEGVFQSFMYYRLQHAEKELTPLTLKNTESETLYRCTLWGSTCANFDCIMEDVLLPDMRSGEWMYFPNMGAYASTLSTNFNGMLKPLVYSFCRKDVWRSLQSSPAD